jgi:serine/threonine protein kinase
MNEDPLQTGPGSGSNSEATEADAPTGHFDVTTDVTTGGSAPSHASGPSGSRAREQPGSLLGPYRLVRTLGSGGMGVVYLAEQQQPVRRSVALKIIKQGMDTEQVIGRFEAERQALALMDHPNIAKVYDAGATEDGRPYFVMELVEGVPITKYCDQHRLTIRERLELFVPVCQAIQHAHQKGVIHRDIKPSNVLVATYDGKPVPKVIDFGIAKATGQQLTEATMFTQLGVVIGTLEYMSPEQAQPISMDIDTRSDIYSLGALLYQLLTGVTPLKASQLNESAYLEMLRKIREDEPLSPSSRLAQSTETLAQTSEERSTDPGRLPKLLRGELDWIVMRALEKDRARRYETANGFARDIQRFLAGEPVEAGPPSATYRLKKFASRNRALLATSAAFAALLIAGAAVSTWQAVRARRAEKAATLARDRANNEAATAKAVTDFLENSLLSQASAIQQSGLDQKPDPDIRVRTLLDRAAAGIGGKFSGQPAVEADIRETIGNTYHDLALMPQAEEQFQKAYDLSLRARGPDDVGTLNALSDLASMRSDQGKYAEAAQMDEKVVAGLTKALGPNDPQTAKAMQSLGLFYMYQGQYPKAEQLLKKAFDIQMRTVGLDNIDTLDTSDSLLFLYMNDRRLPEAEQLGLKALESYKRLYGPNHPNTLREMFGLARIYYREEKYAQAEAMVMPVLDGNIKLLGPEHPSTLTTIGLLANIYDQQGKHTEAVAMQSKVFEARRKLGPDLPNTIASEEELAVLNEHAGNLVRAEQLYKGFTYLTPVSLIRRQLRALWISSVDAAVFASLGDGMPAQHQRSYRAPLEASLDQPRIGETLAVNCLDKAVEPVQRMPFHVALVEAKSKLVHVAVQMLRAGVMVDAMHSSLHDGPNAFNPVRVDRSALVLASRMSHGVVVEKEAADPAIAGSLICHKVRANFDVLHNRALQRFLVSAGDGMSDYPAAALSESYDGNLADRAAPSIQLFGFVLVAFLAAEESLIHFDDSLQFRQFSTASLTQAVDHEPCRLLLYADFLGDLHGRYTLAGSDEQIHRIEPFVERDVRPLEDRASTDRKIKLALVAAVKASLARRDAVLTGTGWAGYAFGPETGLKVDSGGFLIRKHLKKLESADRGSAHEGILICACTMRAPDWDLLCFFNSFFGLADRSHQRCTRIACLACPSQSCVQIDARDAVIEQIAFASAILLAMPVRAADGDPACTSSVNLYAVAVIVSLIRDGCSVDFLCAGPRLVPRCQCECHFNSLFSRVGCASPDVSKVVDSRTNVKKKMRNFCG